MTLAWYTRVPRKRGRKPGQGFVPGPSAFQGHRRVTCSDLTWGVMACMARMIKR